MKNLGGIDHAVVAVRDLEEAGRRMERLGFAVTPRSVHAKLGSANRCLMLEGGGSGGDYVELLSIVEPGPHWKNLAALLEEREGLASLAFKTTDAHAAYTELSAAGLDPQEPLEFSRPVTVDGEERTVAFRITRLPATATPGAQAFFCQHLTPETVWHPSWLRHPNGAVGLSEIVGVAEDLDAVATAYGRLFGEGAVGREADGVCVRPGGAALRFLTPEAFRAAFPGPAPPPTPCFAALGLAVESRDAARRYFEEHEIPHRVTSEGGVLVGPELACGCWLELVSEIRPST